MINTQQSLHTMYNKGHWSTKVTISEVLLILRASKVLSGTPFKSDKDWAVNAAFDVNQSSFSSIAAVFGDYSKLISLPRDLANYLTSPTPQ